LYNNFIILFYSNNGNMNEQFCEEFKKKIENFSKAPILGISLLKKGEGVQDKLKEKMLAGAKDEYVGMFCRENPTYTRFCINFFTAIGLGYLTDDLRAFLENVKNIYSGMEINDNNIDEEKNKEKENEGINIGEEDKKDVIQEEKVEKKVDEDLEKLREKIREKEKMREKMLESETEKEKYTNTEKNEENSDKSVRSSSISHTESSVISVESRSKRRGRPRKKKSDKGSISRSRRRMKSRSRSRSKTHRTNKTNKTKLLRDLNPDYLFKVFGTRDVNEIREKIGKEVNRIKNEYGTNIVFHALSENEQNCLRHALFLEHDSEIFKMVLALLNTRYSNIVN